MFDLVHILYMVISGIISGVLLWLMYKYFKTDDKKIGKNGEDKKNPKANAGKPAPYALGLSQSNDCNIIICDFFGKVKCFL